MMMISSTHNKYGIARLVLLAAVALLCAPLLVFVRATTGVLFVDWWGAQGTLPTSSETSLLRLSLASAALVANDRVRLLQTPTISAGFFAFEVVDSATSACATSNQVQTRLVGSTVQLQDGSRSVVVKDLALAAPRRVVELGSTSDQITQLFAQAPALIALVVVVIILGLIGLAAIATYFVRSRAAHRCCSSSAFPSASSKKEKNIDSDHDENFDEDDDDKFTEDGDDDGDDEEEKHISQQQEKQPHFNPANRFSPQWVAAMNRSNNIRTETAAADSFSALRPLHHDNDGGDNFLRRHHRPALWWQEQAPPVLLQKDDALALGRIGRLAEAVGLSAAAADRLTTRVDQLAKEQNASQLAAFVSSDLKALLAHLDLSRDDARALNQMFSLALACHAWKILPSANSSNNNNNNVMQKNNNNRYQPLLRGEDVDADDETPMDECDDDDDDLLYHRRSTRATENDDQARDQRIRVDALRRQAASQQNVDSGRVGEPAKTTTWC